MHDDPTEAARHEATRRDGLPHDLDLARRLFGGEIEEELIVNAELGIFPVDDTPAPGVECGVTILWPTRT